MRVDYTTYMQSAEWRERANAAKRRAGNRCQVCNRPGSAVTLDAHHRTYERLGQERSEDLTVLCRDCHALYEANKRIPRPPQPAQLPTREDIIASIQLSAPDLSPGKQPLLFVPVKSSKPTASVPGEPPATTSPIAPDSVYRLLPAPSISSPARPSKPALSAAEKSAQATRDSRIRIAAILLVLAMLAAISLLDNRRQASPSTGELRFGPTASTPLVATSTVAAAQIVTATPDPAIVPTVPTVPAVPTVAPPTTTGELATATVTATLASALPPTLITQGIVKQSALVCQNPCSCAPVVRTIPSGTQVNMLETQRCGLDTWIRIGDDEWLGPRFIEEIPEQN